MDSEMNFETNSGMTNDENRNETNEQGARGEKQSAKDAKSARDRETTLSAPIAVSDLAGFSKNENVFMSSHRLG